MNEIHHVILLKTLKLKLKNIYEDLHNSQKKFSIL